MSCQNDLDVHILRIFMYFVLLKPLVISPLKRNSCFTPDVFGFDHCVIEHTSSMSME